MWALHLFAGSSDSLMGPVWDHVGSKRDPGVPIILEAPNDLLGIPSLWIHCDGPYGPYMWGTTPNLSRLVPYSFGSWIILSGRLVNSYITWHVHVSTPSVMFYVGLVCVEDYYGLLGIKDYPVVVRVCCMKYAYGVVLLTWLAMCLVVIPNERLVLDSSSQAPLGGYKLLWFRAPPCWLELWCLCGYCL